MEVQNGALILYLFRTGKASDWATLSHAFGLNPRTSRLDSVAHALHNQLLQLNQLGLIKFEETEPSMPIEGAITVTPLWANLQQALGRPKLRYLAAISAFGNGIAAEPEFGRPEKQENVGDVFVLMPFSADLKPVYEDHIKNVTAELNLSAQRADDFFTHHAVMRDIWSAIFHAKVIIADCTGRNPNVFYEIGIAHTLGRPVVLITQSEKDVPFDLRHIRYIKYKYTPPGMQEFELRLARTLRDTVKSVVD